MSEAAVRAQIRALVEGRQHWLLACDAREQPFVAQVIAAVNGRVGPAAPRVRVDVLDLELHDVDPDSGEDTCAGVLFVVAIPRQALSAETLQALMRQRYGLEASCEDLLAVQFITPVAMPDLWAMGERIKLFTAWLHGDEEDDWHDDTTAPE
jgi:hypothetical protein